MRYTEWVTQLNSNLLSVSEEERRRVVDYYAEAYADRRAAGFSEAEIIDGFGAPYDAAQAILDSESVSSGGERAGYTPPPPSSSRYTSPPPADAAPSAPTSSPYAPPPREKKKENYSWVFVLLCIIFAGPIIGLVAAMVGITIGIGVTPIAVIVGGAAGIAQGIVEMFTVTFGSGLADVGIGLICMGVGVALLNPLFALVKLMWSLFGKFFKWLSGLFKGGDK